jgi:hypothetical protein
MEGTLIDPVAYGITDCICFAKQTRGRKAEPDRKDKDGRNWNEQAG